MAYFIIPYIPDGPITKELKKKLRAEDLNYRIGYLGELMDENFTEAIERDRLLYQPEDLKKLKHVSENPKVVDIAFNILAEKLNAQNVQMPTENESRRPYFPNYRAILLFTLLNAFILTVVITLIVILLPESVALMTTLIVLASVIGAIAFILILYRCVTYVSAT
ncbi:MAG: hypothetical protein AAF633_23540 [Chloroflexota bacterium]